MPIISVNDLFIDDQCSGLLVIWRACRLACSMQHCNAADFHSVNQESQESKAKVLRTILKSKALQYFRLKSQLFISVVAAPLPRAPLKMYHHRPARLPVSPLLPPPVLATSTFGSSLPSPVGAPLYCCLSFASSIDADTRQTRARTASRWVVTSDTCFATA